MAKGKNRNRNTSRPYTGKRDYYTITNIPSPDRVLLPNKIDYTEVEDARRYSPTPRRPVSIPKSITGSPAPYNYKSLDPIRVAFEQPEKVLLCVRRKMRKEVLHALKLTRRKGKGGSYRRTPLSDIHC
nr:MAG: hypothetical protein [Microvirus sp.]